MNELKRTKIDVSGRTVTVPAGAALYHGTGESFDARFPRGGGYDGVFWTTTSPKVARSYIPDAPSTISFQVSNMLRRTLRREADDEDMSILKQLGFTEKIKHAAYAMAERINEKGRDAYRRSREARERIAALTPGGRINDAWKVDDPETVAQIDAAFKEWSKAEDDEKNSRHVSAEDIMGAFVRMKLRTLGYEPYDMGLYGSYRDVKLYGGRVMPADWRLPGRILVARPRRDLNLINMAQGRESDLTELDYHRHDWFEKADAEGYDGIVITDFAQHKGYGNVGHISYGLFKRGVAACEIKAVRDQLHPTIAEWDASESLARRNEVKRVHGRRRMSLFEFYMEEAGLGLAATASDIAARNGVRLDVHETRFTGYVVVDELFVKDEERGVGKGTSAMRELCDWADENGVTLLLTPDLGLGATSKTRLREFYARLGFSKNKDSRFSYSMSRPPKKR